MGWRRGLRSFEAAVHASQRSAKRNARQRERNVAAAERNRSLQRAARAAHDFNAYIERLVSIHKSGSLAINWNERALATAPSPPQRTDLRRDLAKQKLDSYSPWRIAVKLGLAARRRAKIEREIEIASAEDEQEYLASTKSYDLAIRAHLEQKDLADRLLRGDQEAMLEVIRTLKPFAPISELGAAVSVSALTGYKLAANVRVPGETVVPRQTTALLKSGQASVKEMTKASYYGTYRDYVCGLVLRIARELFAILPLDAVMITAIESLLNTRNGNMEDQAIISVYIPRKTFSTLHLESVAPFECMKNFTCSVDFRPASGFRPVAKLDLTKLGYA